MKVTICKSFDFDAAHFLPNVPDGHKCKRLHGHTYRVEVVLVGEVQTESGEAGMVLDYAAIRVVWDPIHTLLDHRLLNEIPGLENPTTEVLAPAILSMLRDSGCLPVARIRVYESSTTWCEVESSEVPAGHYPRRPMPGKQVRPPPTAEPAPAVPLPAQMQNLDLRARKLVQQAEHMLDEARDFAKAVPVQHDDQQGGKAVTP